MENHMAMLDRNIQDFSQLIRNNLSYIIYMVFRFLLSVRSNTDQILMK